MLSGYKKIIRFAVILLFAVILVFYFSNIWKKQALFASPDTFIKSFTGPDENKKDEVSHYDNCMQITSDGGYIVTGWTSNYGAPTSFGSTFTVKFDSAGNFSWGKAIEQVINQVEKANEGYGVKQTSDGGYTTAGYVYDSSDGYDDGYIYKLNSAGNFSWAKKYGRPYQDRFYSIDLTLDGGYIVAGVTRDHVLENNDWWVYVLKLDSLGNISWAKAIDGPNEYDAAYSIKQTSDGGYILAGRYTQSYLGPSDFLVVKLDSLGNISWTRAIGGADWDEAFSIIQTSDGGYIVIGGTSNYGGETLVVKLNSSGNLSWAKVTAEIDGTESDIIEASDGGYVITGSSDSYGAEDPILLKLDSSGNFSWAKLINRYCGFGFGGWCLEQASNGDYVMAGHTKTTFGEGYDILLTRTDSNGNVPVCNNTVPITPSINSVTPSVYDPGVSLISINVSVTSKTPAVYSMNLIDNTNGDVCSVLGSVITNPATNILFTQATLNGDLLEKGIDCYDCDVWFEWGQTVSYGNTTTLQSKSSTGAFSDTISGLSPGTTYHFRTVTQNSIGISYGNDQSFTTLTSFSPSEGYAFTFIKSTNPNDISSWGPIIELDASDNENKYGVITPMLSGEMYATWIDGTAIEGKLYTGGAWQPLDSIAAGETGTNKNMSTVSDDSGNIHLIYVNSAGNIIYQQYNGVWQSAIILDSNTQNEYPTISINRPNNDLYAFWVRGDHIYYKKGVSPYGTPNWDSEATDWHPEGINKHITSGYEDFDSYSIFIEWTEGSAAPYTVKFDKIDLTSNLFIDSFAANPDTGEAPLNNVDLIVQISGGVGTINYTFYCDRADMDTDITPDYACKSDGVITEDYSLDQCITDTGTGSLCSYTSSGTYSGKVIVERGAGAATDIVSIDVSEPTGFPQAQNLTSDQAADYCGYSYPPVYLSWEFFDPDLGFQDYYQVQIDNNSDFSSIEKDSGKVNSASESYAPTTLSYETTYYWRVKVWDDQGEESSWAEDLIGFTTQECPPAPGFSWSPEEPIVGQETQFTDESVPCTTISSWDWTFELGNPLTSSDQNPVIIFTEVGIGGENQVTQTVTDSNGKSCSMTQSVGVTLPLPEWQEVTPF